MSRRYLRPSIVVGHVLVLAAALTCLRLGWWQWNVFEFASRGTVQNFGYALLWPVFAGAFIYMWLRFLHLESVRDGAPDAVDAADADEIGGAADGLAFDVGGDGAAGGLVAEAGGDGASGAGSPTAAAARSGGDGDVGSDGDSGGDGVATGAAVAPVVDDGRDSDEGPPGIDRRPRRRRGHSPPSTAYTIAVATVGDDDDDDPQLAAYNRALAALAEQDQRRAR